MDRSLMGYALALAGLLTLAGCEANQYEIELTPKEGAIERDLTTWRGSAEKPTNLPQEELTKIADAYGVPVPVKKDARHQFKARFAGEIPQDLGGSGRYAQWKTALGSAHAYVERYRGNDNLLAEVERRLKASDKLVDHLIGWLESELKTEADFPALRKYLDDQLRQDVKNLSLYAWRAGTKLNYDDSVQSDFLVRAGQYLLERNYFSAEDLPLLFHGFQQSEKEGIRRLLQATERFLAGKMGIPADKPIPESLSFLSSPAAIEASINPYLRETEDYKARLARWETDKEADPTAKQPEPEDVLGEPAVEAFGLTLVPPDRLSVKLNTPQAPFRTNGKWDEADHCVRWTERILPAGSELSETPTLLYAFWSQPDQKVQKQHFGQTVLSGENLFQYALWYKGLSQPQAKEWDEFLSALQPNQKLGERLRSFRFSHEEKPAEGDGPSGLAERPCKLLLENLSKEAP